VLRQPKTALRGLRTAFEGKECRKEEKRFRKRENRSFFGHLRRKRGFSRFSAISRLHARLKPRFFAAKRRLAAFLSEKRSMCAFSLVFLGMGSRKAVREGRKGPVDGAAERTGGNPGPAGGGGPNLAELLTNLDSDRRIPSGRRISLHTTAQI
jgi:hypothetical protein